MEISREMFDQQRQPRFGNANPERMTLAFWEWMIRGDETSATDREGRLEELGFRMREGKLKSAYGPYRARDLFKIPLHREDGPIWTFDRMGTSRSQLPDGRVICVGGEHEDYYDPDFCIYNDVVVLGPYDQIEIYGYPKEVFRQRISTQPRSLAIELSLSGDSVIKTTDVPATRLSTRSTYRNTMSPSLRHRVRCQAGSPSTKPATIRQGSSQSKAAK